MEEGFWFLVLVLVLVLGTGGNLSEIYIASDAVQLILAEVKNKDQGLIAVGYFDDLAHRGSNTKNIQEGVFAHPGSYAPVQGQLRIRNTYIDHQVFLSAAVKFDAVPFAREVVDGVNAGCIVDITEGFFPQGKLLHVVFLEGPNGKSFCSLVDKLL